MDKYTVDLDQVLNDFEYSELTDQYSNASRFPTGNTSANQNITKHSINNVFHSLNEYLNTSISGVDKIDNKLEVKNNHVEDVTVLNINQKIRDGEKSIKDCNLKTDNRLLDFTVPKKENNVTEHEVRFLEPASDNIVDEYQNNAAQVKENEVGFLGENKDNFEDGCKNDTAQVKEEDEIGVLEETGDKIVDRCKSSNEENTAKVEICTENNISNGSNELKEESLGYDEDEKTDELCCIQNEAEVTEELENKNNTPEDSSQLEDDGSNSNKEEVFEEVKKQTVGFHDDLNLDDSEINRLLDELEEEGLETSEDKKSQDIAHVASTDSVDEVEEEKETQERDDAAPEENVVITEISNVEKVHEPSEAPPEDNNLEITLEGNDGMQVEEKSGPASENSLLKTEESYHEDEECNSSKENTTDIEPVLENEKEDNEKQVETLDMTPNEEKLKEVAEETKVDNGNKMLVIEKENSQDSLTRPHNLPLKGEGDEPKRKINLIGDPGSTPYNNVYINKEIPKSKQKSYDSDTDYSTSSSPTFSDVSSTASTVSVDEMRNIDRNLLNPPHVDMEKVSVQTDQAETNTSVTENPSSEKSNPTSEIENLSSKKTEQLLPCDGDEEVPESGRSMDNLGNDIAEADQMGTGAPEVEDICEITVGTISDGKQWLGKEAPLWIPDSDATSCLHCDMKFTVLKRRHHCRACGLVLCSKCCHLRFKLQYLEAEARVCNKCVDILNKDTNSSSGSDLSPEVGNSPSYRPHPNNPLEYCSTVSPLQQVAGSNTDLPAVMVPVGVLKRKGSNKGKSNKSVMFCDGIRPGSDLTNLDNDFDYNNTKTRKSEKTNSTPVKLNKNLPTVDPETNTFIPSNENLLPPTISACKTDIIYMECSNNPDTVELLKNEQLTFAIHISLNVHLKIISMSCCINKMAWCFSTEGLINVGQDEIVILLENIDEESFVPKDIFYHLNNLYNDAVKGTSVKEMGLSLHNTSNFLDSKNHAGFVYIRPTFQCLENVIKPKEPYLIGILIHRWETPWAKLFPLRLILRLGAEYRYYPSPIISTRHRESVFVEIGHTIINLLADFRNFSYTLPQIRGLTIHMEDKNTTITIPVNRYDQVMKSMNNSSDHILAFAGNFSLQADSHLVCIQDTQGLENCYSTHAINIHNKPRKVTGASFIVFNGALKSSSGLTAKSNIVEDGLMIQVLPEHMQLIRENLRAMKNHTIPCGCVNAASDETVNIVWGENDVNFNIGVISAIDNMPLNGIPSIRVHNGKNHVCANGSRIIRWTEVFIIQSGDDNPKNQDPIDVSRVSESIAKATCDALVKYLDLLVVNNSQKIGIRTTLHVENVSYSAGSNGAKLPPIYMKSLDNELIPVLHRITTNNLGENAVVLELVFRILNI